MGHGCYNRNGENANNLGGAFYWYTCDGCIDGREFTLVSNVLDFYDWKLND